MNRPDEIPNPQLGFQKVFDRMVTAAEEALKECPELRSMTMIADWRIDSIELPVGIMIGRGGVVRHPEELFGAAQQTLKMLFETYKNMTELFHSADDLMERLGKEIKRRGLILDSDDIDIPPTGSADP